MGYVRTYGMRRSGCFPEWSMVLLAFANRPFTLSCLDRLLRPILVNGYKGFLVLDSYE